MHSPTLSTYPQRDDCDVITHKYPKCVRTRHSPRRYDEAQATGIHRIQEAFKKIARIAHNFILEQTPRGPHKNVLNLSRPLSYTESEPQNLVALEKKLRRYRFFCELLIALTRSGTAQESKKTALKLDTFNSYAC